ncbi:MAG: hypothetical protein WD850_00070 [Candidatus Spechtbacterales bacterium]
MPNDSTPTGVSEITPSQKVVGATVAVVGVTLLMLLGLLQGGTVTEDAFGTLNIGEEDIATPARIEVLRTESFTTSQGVRRTVVVAENSEIDRIAVYLIEAGDDITQDTAPMVTLEGNPGNSPYLSLSGEGEQTLMAIERIGEESTDVGIFNEDGALVVDPSALGAFLTANIENVERIQGFDSWESSTAFWTRIVRTDGSQARVLIDLSNGELVEVEELN